MAGVFERIWELSLSGSVIVLAVLALRMVLRRAPRRAVCLLWMLAVLRLLVPFEIESDWSLQPELPTGTLTPAVQEEYFDSGTAPGPVEPELLEDAVAYPVQPVPEETTEPVEILPWVWAAGAAALAIHGAVSYLRLKRRVRDSVILGEGVWVCPGLDTAFVLGFFRPRVYLPVLPEEERELVLLHERQHIRRLDHWWKLAAYAAVTLHWFNPLAWVTYVLLCRDMELACDQETVKGMDNAKRKAYSAALLNCAAKRSGIAACPVAFGEISVKERIKMVLNYKKPGFWVTVVALIAAIAVGVCLMTSPREMNVNDLEKCEQALEQWQGMESIHLQVSSVHEGDLALNSWTETEYWASGANALIMHRIDDHLRTTTWRALLDGQVYICHTCEDKKGDTIYVPWKEDPDSQQWDIPFILNQDWSTWQFTHLRTETTELGMDIYLEAYYPDKDTFEMVFSFEGDVLKEVCRTFTNVVADEREEDGIMASQTVQTFKLMETEQEIIETHMKQNGPKTELVQLYRELEELQNSQRVHLVIEQEIDSDYPGWETCRQEFISAGDCFYRNFDYQSQAGAYTTTYLQYGGAVYAREFSEAGVVPNRDWERIQDKGAGELPLLNLDWTKFEVLCIEKQEDGGAVITLQGSLEPTQDTTYYAKTYEFHLDLTGKLTTLIISGHYRKEISDGFAQGTFTFRGTDTVHILHTPREELTKRILEAAIEVMDYRSGVIKGNT